jgi:hypothetical protein
VTDELGKDAASVQFSAGEEDEDEEELPESL